MPSPLSNIHGSLAVKVIGLLDAYEGATPDTATNTEATWLMVDEETPQPDLCLWIRPECGGQSREEGNYCNGAPELLVEIAVTSVARDLGDKLEVYRASGVQEYVVVLVPQNEVRWHRLANGQYQVRPPGADGIHRSEIFPGLWLDGNALLQLNRARLHEVLHEGLASMDHATFVQRLAQARQQGESQSH